MTEILGKRRRTTYRNSNPDIFGMLRSDTITSGELFDLWKGVETILRGGYILAFPLQQLRKYPTDTFFVVHHENAIFTGPNIAHNSLLRSNPSLTRGLSHFRIHKSDQLHPTQSSRAGIQTSRSGRLAVQSMSGLVRRGWLAEQL